MQNVDDVNGQIIGGDYGTAWVTYCGRKQGPTCYPQNEMDAYNQCNKILQDIKANLGESFKLIYPLEAWMFHFDGV